MNSTVQRLSDFKNGGASVARDCLHLVAGGGALVGRLIDYFSAVRSEYPLETGWPSSKISSAVPQLE